MPVNKQCRRKRQTDLPMAPICSLSYDVLAEIFMILWAQSYTSTDRPPLLPTKLGAVSSFWRQVAWSTPRLWTELELTNRFWWSQDRIYILDTYFRNMGSFMLRLSICDYPTDMEARQSRKSQKRRGKRLKSPDTTLTSFDGLEDIPFPAQDVFKIIFIHHPDKLRTVVMDKYIFPWLEEIENISESSGFPNLEVLGITSDEGEDPALAFSPYTDSHPSINIQNVPRLRSVVLIGTRNRFFLPWAQILVLDLSSVNAEYAMQVVLECVNLQDLHVSDLEESPMDRGSPSLKSG
ncbi:hypothetical protein D9756_009429 [Leucocoprinus leucothites]|uniref:F-box domain-containing protein n=1 Tax=Leucocoprinus leucothites TaxID=201217 RepID=A0A8H5FUD7_9AGAR|nr:hypothetical protein D9756_009429 [Leucoagaricus leucothites]